MWQMPSALAVQVTAADVQTRAVGERIETAEDAARLFRLAVPLAGSMEGFFVLPLDTAGHAFSAPVMVALGHETGTAVVDPAKVYREALKAGAEEIIVAHNHPSGDPTPSKADYDTTAKLNDGANLVGLKLLDHLIIGSPESANGLGFVSMAELRAE